MQFQVFDYRLLILILILAPFNPRLQHAPTVIDPFELKLIFVKCNHPRVEARDQRSELCHWVAMLVYSCEEFRYSACRPRDASHSAHLNVSHELTYVDIAHVGPNFFNMKIQ